ncbi:MAG: 30S ribosomal protein S17 [Candidatus Kerfeldbacteria bacterium]|nr:30S ribosomal protein S17 [Candidatus Kerfeldbacteria bacterium]
MTKAPIKTRRHFQGEVVSAAQTKTIVVRIDRHRFHPIYKKRYTVSRKFQVHDEKQQYKVGDVVEFVECRPISKNKKWRVLYKPTV